ncbi:hypothetical protein WN944_027881 [Citrus x changshan-huyou]|uniref:Uncharacterized protein n=1 Tax=Citrus x changshan-huyou TaxID=2935761 RepID=A0AAP0LIS2_9ROSI
MFLKINKKAELPKMVQHVHVRAIKPAKVGLDLDSQVKTNGINNIPKRSLIFLHNTELAMWHRAPQTKASDVTHQSPRRQCAVHEWSGTRWVLLKAAS